MTLSFDSSQDKAYRFQPSWSHFSVPEAAWSPGVHCTRPPGFMHTAPHKLAFPASMYIQNVFMLMLASVYIPDLVVHTRRPACKAAAAERGHRPRSLRRRLSCARLITTWCDNNCQHGSAGKFGPWMHTSSSPLARQRFNLQFWLSHGTCNFCARGLDFTCRGDRKMEPEPQSQ